MDFQGVKGFFEQQHISRGRKFGGQLWPGYFMKHVENAWFRNPKGLLTNAKSPRPAYLIKPIEKAMFRKQGFI